MKIKINKCTGDLWYKNHKFPMYTDVVEATSRDNPHSLMKEFNTKDYYYSEEFNAYILKTDTICNEPFMSAYDNHKKERVYPGGAKRDSNEGKTRPDLISPKFLKVLGDVLRKGASKYGERNWEKGISQESFKESAARHYVSWMNGDTDEDHAGNLAFNLMGWIHFREIENDSKKTK